MYLDMQLVDDRRTGHEVDEGGRESVAASDSSSPAAEQRERLVALLQCAYGWSRVQALRQVDGWMAMEAQGSLRPGD
jgi:hypothetical protein